MQKVEKLWILERKCETHGNNMKFDKRKKNREKKKEILNFDQESILV